MNTSPVHTSPVNTRPAKNSCIYKGVIRHHRYTPSAHAFHYQLHLVYLDLDEADALIEQTRWWKRNKGALASFNDHDFFDDSHRPLKHKIIDYLDKQWGKKHIHTVCMLANLRYFGLIFNPIVNYYCFDERGALVCILAEVTNTPWNEKHHYLIDFPADTKYTRASFRKDFHVSPFMPMDMQYDWVANQPADTLNLYMANTDPQGRKVFDAVLKLKRMDISSGALDRLVLSYPWMTAKTVAGIYWQAFRLFLKRTPFFAHPGTPITHSLNSLSKRSP